MTNQPTGPKQPNKRGRQTALTPELQAKLVQVLEAGNYIEAACDYVGISYNTFAEWIRRGENTDNRVATELYANFANAIKKARSGAEISSVARIRKAGNEGQWQADAWWLERSFPNRWGRQRLEITGAGNGPLEIKHWKIDGSTYDAAIASIAIRPDTDSKE